MSNGIKKIAWAFCIFFIFISLGINKAQAGTNRGVSLQVFYDELSYYGDWVNNPDYGYVWRPNVGRDFRPYYTNGHWVMTEYGNTWASDYDWGWAPFHYGRWFYDDYDGWIWAPDTEWGPAWVTWRTGGGYYGWAPLGPRINININLGRHHYVPDNYWVFIPQRCIYYPSYSRYWEPRRNVYIVHNTTIINNIYTNDRVRYYSGPGRDDVRRATRSEVPIYRITDNSRPGSTRVSRGEVNIYRPTVGRSESDAPRSIASNSARPSRGDAGNSRTVNSSDRSSSVASRPDRSSSIDSRSVNNSSDRSSTYSGRPERAEVARPSEPSPRTESMTRSSSSSSSSRSEAPSNRPERAEIARPSAPSPRTESTTRSSSPSSSSRSEAPSSRPQRVERSAPSVQSSPSPSRSSQSSSPSSSSGSRSSSSSSRSGGSGRPSR